MHALVLKYVHINREAALHLLYFTRHIEEEEDDDDDGPLLRHYLFG